ncbi:hypothetical protein GUITHDRAFT_107503 [Guillardia theta CCMP2712]|uniref:protein-tyrosine-phosphatase n=1 Tax=Guillardia theta (strain CCMP2712) TaxID=905079 RepID=L1JDY5_GUITC|nr:hypothetical protein GUITHDRAFT_107503 [Guillardia theta CCMP2712]EKX46726.1 hypothetical protein GUITHDRAFT_107503 [Guillardia theta CCMP2712]|eukprot:XP_005833706.1 hypothetical protein GUITHDRAFT_107503 [Guillardia theta CCMP2712]
MVSERGKKVTSRYDNSGEEDFLHGYREIGSESPSLLLLEQAIQEIRDGEMYPISPKIFLLASYGIPTQYDNSRYAIVDLDEFLVYFPFAQDFGPVDASCIIRFCQSLTRILRCHSNKTIILRSPPTAASITNAVLLIGAYEILCQSSSCREACLSCRSVPSSLLLPYLDATRTGSCLLPHKHVLAGLQKAHEQGWLEGMMTNVWELEEYEHYADPLNGDINVIIPHKLLALQSPTDRIPDGQEWTDEGYVRKFHPKFLLRAFQAMDVKCVVRLNASQYDPKIFTDRGIQVVDLFCSDSPVPSTQIIFRFIQLVEKACGLVAVHCDNGLGLTGCIIGTYLMAMRGFTAKEAVGWIRVMRPGSVLGAQQEFLESHEHAMQRAGMVMETRNEKIPGEAEEAVSLTSLEVLQSSPWRRQTNPSLAVMDLIDHH